MSGVMVSEEAQRLHRRLHRKPRPLRYEPLTVAEALRKLRRSLESSIIIGTYGFITGDLDAASAIIEMERIIDEVAFQFFLHASVAVGRSIDDALKVAPLYTYVFAVDKVMDALKDLASAIVMGSRLSQEMSRRLLESSSHALAKLETPPLQGTVGEIMENYGVDIVALRRSDGSWLLEPDPAYRLAPGDVSYLWGDKDQVNKLLAAVGKEPIPERSGEGLEKRITSSIDILLVLNGLAHYQLVAQDQQLAEEILELELYLDNFREKNTKEIISANNISLDDKYMLTVLVTRIEDISDALTYIILLPQASVEEEEEETIHELLRDLLEESDERITLLRAVRSVNLGILAEALDQLGARILAVRIRGEWIAYTPMLADRSLSPGDTALIQYEKLIEKQLVKTLRQLGLQPLRDSASEES